MTGTYFIEANNGKDRSSVNVFDPEQIQILKNSNALAGKLKITFALAVARFPDLQPDFFVFLR